MTSRWSKALGLAASSLAGCAGLLGIDEPAPGPSAPPGEGGGAGAHELPAGAAGSAGLTPGPGGSGAAGGRGGSGAGGRSTTGGESGAGQSGSEGGLPGRGGSAAGGTPNDGGDAGGAGDSGGEGGAPEPFVHHANLNDPCDREGELACYGQLPTKRRLICSAGKWVNLDDCDEGDSTLYYCDTRTGACALGDYRCGNGDYCLEFDNIAVTCAADGTHLEKTTQCVFGCTEGHCVPPERDQLVVDEPPPISISPWSPYWPSWLIPVCFEGSSQPSDAEVLSVREEVTAAWSRYSRVHFTGFDACDDGDAPEARVVVRFEEDCGGELSGIDRVGYPGAGASSNVFFCRQHRDARGATQVTSQALLRYAVRHQFGHVLGFPDEFTSFDADGDYGLMTQGVEAERLDELLASLEYTSELQRNYGSKPSGSLVSSGGECLKHGESGFELDDCLGGERFAFRFDEQQFFPESAESQCLTARDGGPAELTACADDGSRADQAFVLRDVYFRAFGERCLRLAALASEAVVLDAAPCAGNSLERWDFHFLADGYVRVENPEWGYCLGIPRTTTQIPPTTQSDSVQLVGSCLASERIVDRFRFTGDGRLAFGGYCLSPGDPSSDYHRPTIAGFLPCSLDPDQVVHATGRIQNESFGALSLLPSGQHVELGTVLGEAQPNQIFDFYF